MKALRVLHHWLGEGGKIIAHIVLFLLALGLFFAPIVAMLAASFVGAAFVASAFSGGPYVIVVLFFVFIGLVGIYIAPHVQPQLGNAFVLLLKN